MPRKPGAEELRTLVAEMIDPRNGEVLEAVVQLRAEAEAHVAEASVAQRPPRRTLLPHSRSSPLRKLWRQIWKRRSSLLQHRTQLNGEQKKIVTLEAALRTNQEAKQVLPRVEALEVLQWC